MKKNIFPYSPDKNLTDNVDRLLQFVREPIQLDSFFKKFPIAILNAKLDQLEFEYMSNEKSLIIKKNPLLFNLTNKLLSSLWITVNDPTQLVNPLIQCKKDLPNLNLKDALTNLITVNHDKNKQININSATDILKNNTLDQLDNKNKQIEINLFFEFLKKQILQQSNSKQFFFFFPKTETLLAAVNNELISWCYSAKNTFIFRPNNAGFSKKYTELDDLINKLDNDFDCLAQNLRALNNGYLEILLNTPESDLSIIIIRVIENFQCATKNTIDKFIKDNPLSLEQLNIFYKILNAIARLIPSFIMPKNKRIGFFQPYTPQNKILEKLEKTIQLKF